MKRNRRWISDMKREGREIKDIGPEFVRRARRAEQGLRPDSPFYNMERMETSNYSGYQKVFERTGKYEGGVSGLDW